MWARACVIGTFISLIITTYITEIVNDQAHTLLSCQTQIVFDNKSPTTVRTTHACQRNTLVGDIQR